MARMIVVDEKRFDELFEAARKELELDKFVAQRRNGVPDHMTEPLNELHRTFNSVVCRLRDRLKDAT